MNFIFKLKTKNITPIIITSNPIVLSLHNSHGSCNDIHHLLLLLPFMFRESYDAIDLGKQRMILSHPNIVSWVPFLATLTNNDRSCPNLHVVSGLHSQSSSGGVTSVVRRSTGFLRGRSDLREDCAVAVDRVIACVLWYRCYCW